ncbi:Panacea domain-containing protein [Spiroplasma endosymbiont of Glossina fuscipes fuscipes]|uniref:Panacea domain-containing protein n=1 Tax=Spiroplasma endosymbiont of Glossina fuscipes fuscipes TaxID=2004463 RepID=UPI003CE6D588
MNKVKYKINNDIIFSITKYLVEKYNIKEPVKLQKILYFLYLDYLKQYDEKLFDDEFEAWIYGPVIRKIFNHIRYNGYNFIEIESYTDKYLEIEKIQYLTDEKVKNFINENIKKIHKYVINRISRKNSWFITMNKSKKKFRATRYIKK